MIKWWRKRAAQAWVRARQQEVAAYDRDCMRRINELRAHEGWSVTLICDNPDFDNGPNHAIEVFGEWYFKDCNLHTKGLVMPPELVVWGNRTFRGDLLLECRART